MDSFFDQGQDAYLQALEQFTHESHEISDLSQLGSVLVEEVSRFLLSAGAYLFLPSSGGFFSRGSGPRLPDDPDEVSFKASGAFIQRLSQSDKPLTWQELDDPLIMPVIPPEEWQILKRISALISFPIKTGDGELIGVFILKARLSSEPYSRQDKQWITLILLQTSFSLEKIRLYQALREAGKQMRIVRQFAAEAEGLRSMGQVLRDTAHDFNNLFAGIVGRTQLSLSETGDENIKRHILSIEKATLKADDLVRRLREAAGLADASAALLIDLDQKYPLNQIEQWINAGHHGEAGLPPVAE